MVVVSEMTFQRKRNPETYPCTPLFLTVCNHRNDYCLIVAIYVTVIATTIMIATVVVIISDHRERAF